MNRSNVSLTASRRAMATSLSPTIALSVISRVSRSGGRPDTAKAARTSRVGTTRSLSGIQSPAFSSQARAYFPAGTASGLARAMRRTDACFRSAGAVTRRGVSAGPTTTRRLDRNERRDAASTSPAAATLSIQSSSAEKKRSARAAAMICRARSFEAPRLNTSRTPRDDSQPGARSWRTSRRLAAA